MSVRTEASADSTTPGTGYAPGSQVLVRDELWLVRTVSQTGDGWMLEVTGVSSLVRGMDAVFYESLDKIDSLDPRRTGLVGDDSPNHRRARLFLEAVIRKTALPQTERGLATVGGFLMDEMTHQLRPAEQALSGRTPEPRILIADVVGLGKTLEIGILLAELIRRGRGSGSWSSAPSTCSSSSSGSCGPGSGSRWCGWTRPGSSGCSRRSRPGGTRSRTSSG